MPLHYKKDGSLDMRYNSSRAASSGGGSSYSGYSSPSSSGGGNNVHYKKDGTLDMRYNSSKADYGEPSLSGSNYASPQRELHYKKDGTLDMRYTSSRSGVSAYGNVVTKKDGTLDMRYKSSQVSTLTENLGRMGLNSIPAHVPRTKAGFPDMRTNAGKEWVRSEAQRASGLPSWIPTRKDGAPDTSKAVVQEFLRQQETDHSFEDHLMREKYYTEKMCDPSSCFKLLVEAAREQEIKMPETCILPETPTLRQELSSSNGSSSNTVLLSQIPDSVLRLDYPELKSSFPDEEKCQIGKGNFGTVFKGKWRGQDVAVKRLHLTQLTRKEIVSFVKELKIMTVLGKHPNLVTLIGYTLEPPCFVMEYVRLGSLSFILHYCEDC